MSSWRQQGLVDAPVAEVWGMVGDPNRYPEWASEIASVTGLPKVEEDAKFSLSRFPTGENANTFQIEEIDEMRSIGMRCLDTRTFLRLALTDAQGQTFVDIEAGADEGTAELSDESKTFFRRLTDGMLDGLRGALA